MTTDHSEPPTRAQRFGAYTARAARAAGYDIDSPRGGGKKALATRAGMSHASVSRMLAGLTIPDTSFFESLAKALRVPVSQMLIESGIVSEESLARPVVSEKPLNPRDVAEQLGIVSAEKIDAFEAMVRVLIEGDHGTSGFRRSA
ncbi:helix-turn-helix domain-containing protein [Streptomyces meridianus]|uniref:Helix-turn-helix domain-containing protein n=1 Tax=Streptomyces meridianus TaxID=2938945 RepID=A0ABT0XAG6_9ACTN|nr:helix-turn-helix transcriptional regulator [Streptomyces meridianus]MCM2579520.1 helix-turn-helix domain-containing protein [Streptomyces meridianus]